MNPSNLVELVFLNGKPGLISIPQKRMVSAAKHAAPNLGFNQNKNFANILFCMGTLQTTPPPDPCRYCKSCACEQNHAASPSIDGLFSITESPEDECLTRPAAPAAN